jgi:hypothetical protein
MARPSRKKRRGWGGPQQSEDTALRALRGWPCRLRSRVSDEGRQYGNQGNAIAATVKRRAASALVCRRHAWLERKLKVNKALARHERPAQADQAPPVRRTSGAPSLRGGVGVSRPLEASEAYEL